MWYSFRQPIATIYVNSDLDYMQIFQNSIECEFTHQQQKKSTHEFSVLLFRYCLGVESNQIQIHKELINANIVCLLAHTVGIRSL